MTPDVAAWLARHKPTKCPTAHCMQPDVPRKVRPMWRGGKAPLYIGTTEKLTKAQAKVYRAAALWQVKPAASATPKPKAKIGRPANVAPVLDLIEAAHRAHPDWNCKQIAAALGKRSSHVRRSLARRGLKAAPEIRRKT